MHKIVHALTPAVIALVAAAGMSQAQSPQGPQPPQRGQQTEPRRQPPSPETMQRLQEGRLAMIKTALKLTDAQLKLWEPVEAQLRARHAARVKDMQERMQSRQQNAAPPSLTDRMERRTAREAQRAEQDKAFLTVLKPFYATLTEEQKPVAERLLGEMRGGGHRHAGHHGGRGPHQGLGGRPL